MKTREFRSALMNFTQWVFVKKELPETRHRPSGEQACVSQHSQHVMASYSVAKFLEDKKEILVQQILDSEAWATRAKALMPTKMDKTQPPIEPAVFGVMITTSA